MNFIKTPLADCFVIEPHKIIDERGVFARTFCKDEFKQRGFNKEFLQFNSSYNKMKGTLRGMHYQSSPYCEAKLIRCVQGSVLDVAVDLRAESLTFLKHFQIELSEENMLSILIPEGFAHGFQVLTDNSTMIYHHTEYYNRNADAGLRFDDPVLNINWKLPPVNVSDKDRSYKLIDNNFRGVAI
jgi:dTDP-4-dehydrorhamnose 3,5-epimerase